MIRSDCCGARYWQELDICADCKEHCDTYDDDEDEEIKEFRIQLSQVDGMATELTYLTTEVEDFKDESLRDELEDILYQLETVINNIQESEGWI